MINIMLIGILRIVVEIFVRNWRLLLLFELFFGIFYFYVNDDFRDMVFFSGKLIVIIGVVLGIGKVIFKLLVSWGVLFFLLDISEVGLKFVYDEISGAVFDVGLSYNILM